MNETHTYPDGSQRVGCPPFPKFSPLEQEQGKTAPAEAQTVEVEAPKRGRKPKAEAAE